MKLTFALNQARYRDTLNTFVRGLKADADLLLREEMRLLLRDIVNLTPPTRSPKSDQVKRSAKQRGDSAVEADLSRVANPLDWKNIVNPRLAEAVYRRNETVMLAIMKNMKQYRNASILSDSSAIKASHLQNRNRYGRVRRKVLNQVAFFLRLAKLHAHREISSRACSRRLASRRRGGRTSHAELGASSFRLRTRRISAADTEQARDHCDQRLRENSRLPEQNRERRNASSSGVD